MADAAEQQPPVKPPPIAAHPWLAIPEKRVICIEHPAAVRNSLKAVASIGGAKALVKLAATNGNSGLNLRFRTQDVMEPPIQSRTVPTNNILLKVTIPRRRRKRRAADDENGTDTTAPQADGNKNETVLEKLRASKGRYQIEAVGTIGRTVRFRDMANYQFNTAHSQFVKKMEDTMLDCDYEKLQKFEVAQGKGYETDMEILPPPSFSNTVMQHTYNYRQNPAIKKAMIGGQPALLNLQAAPKTLTPMVHISTKEIPVKPTNLRPYESLDSPTRQCVDHLRNLFQERHIWTRRALFNHFPKSLQSLVRFSMVHVAYMWRAGPWRDTCVRYGIDPRTSDIYRKYQSVFFQVETEKTQREREAARTKNSHIFDGVNLVRDGRCFQLCDITDPLLKSLVDTDRTRQKWDVADGWYRSSTMSKIKTIMRAKIRALAEGIVIPDAEFVPILERDSEDEEQIATRKEKEAGEKITRDQKKDQRRSKKRSVAPNGVSGGHSNLPEEDEEEDEEEDVDGDWEEELDVDFTTPPPPQEQGTRADGRVEQLMMELLRQGEEHTGYDVTDYMGVDMQYEGDFDVLGGDDNDDGNHRF